MITETRPEYIKRKVVGYFNLAEVKTICFDLGVSYDDLPHATRGELFNGLVDLLVENDKKNEVNLGNARKLSGTGSLITLVTKLRPNMNLGDMPKE